VNKLQDVRQVHLAMPVKVRVILRARLSQQFRRFCFYEVQVIPLQLTKSVFEIIEFVFGQLIPFDDLEFIISAIRLRPFIWHTDEVYKRN
jgi:hypothetical protein